MNKYTKTLKDFDDIEIRVVHYGAWDTGTRIIHMTPIPLWEETTTYGNPMFGMQSKPIFTAWPDKLPDTLPDGAIHMNDDDSYFGPYIQFDDELSALIYCTSVD
jgi:hypothetical protein